MKTVSIRDLQRNMKEISSEVQKGESFAVFKNSKLIFQINPAENIDIADNGKTSKETTLHELFKDLQLDSPDQSTSENIDDIVYKH